MEKNRVIFLIILLLFVNSSIKTQTTAGKEFWFTFAQNANYNKSDELQIRIVGGDQPASVSIYFTNIGNSVNFNVPAKQVVTHILTDLQQQATINYTSGISNLSIHITTDEPVMVYAMNHRETSTDVTNVLPVKVLGTDYYHISYTPVLDFYLSDAYLVIGTQNNTKLYHNGKLEATLNSGQVYYKTSYSDMTGSHITASEPVAFIAVNQWSEIPQSFSNASCLMQQLAPVNRWGKNFFVPVSNKGFDIVRIVASEDNTTIFQSGGSLLYNSSGQSNSTINAGQYIELEVFLENRGCYIRADKPIGVCTYLTAYDYKNVSGSYSAPAQAWLPAIEHTVTETLISAFTNASDVILNSHYAIVISKTDTKNETKVSIKGGQPIELNGGNWIDNAEADMSFYTMPLEFSQTDYHITNNEGIIVMAYGVGSIDSYYYPAGSTMPKLLADFYTNEIHWREMSKHFFCTNDITFKSEIRGMGSIPGSLKWYIDEVEEIAAQDQLIWTKNFLGGNYEIKMVVCSDEGDTLMLESPLHIGVHISTDANPSNGGITDGDGCYKVGDNVELKAIANTEYNFVKWTDENDIEVSTNEVYNFVADTNINLTANFEIKKYTVSLSANPNEGGVVFGDGIYNLAETVTVTATSGNFYNFINWTKQGAEVSKNSIYTFEVKEDISLVANFRLKSYNVEVISNPVEGGNVSGSGTFTYGDIVTVSSTPNKLYKFINWTINDIEVSISESFQYTVKEDVKIVANFEKILYKVNIDINNNVYGYATGEGFYEALTTAKVEAFAYDSYQFQNWTKNDLVVSYNNVYEFSVTEDITLIANFYGLDFDTYAITLWNNTFMLNLKKLAEDGYDVIGCLWFKNGIEEKETNTIDQFSYSAGPNKTDLLEFAPTYYMYQLITTNFGNLFSSKKIIQNYNLTSKNNISIFPNPIKSGDILTIKGVEKGSFINIYNQYGIHVIKIEAKENTVTFAMDVPAGIYFIHNYNKEVKIVIIK